MAALAQEAIDAIRIGARAMAMRAVMQGTPMVQEGAALGLWAKGPVGRFFVELALADRAYVKPSDDPNDHFAVWAQGKKGAVQMRVDSKSGKIVNADEILHELLGMDEDEQAAAMARMQSQVEGEEGEDGGEGEPPRVVQAGEYLPLEALAVGGGVVTLSVDPLTGHVRDWFNAEPFLLGRAVSPVELADVRPSRYVRVRAHTKKDGTHVAAHQRRVPIGMPETPAAPKGAPQGAEFHGYAPHAGYDRPKARTATVDGAKTKVEAPEEIDAPEHWAVHRYPSATRGEHGAYGLFHPETGEPAPEGVRTGWLHGEDDLGGLRAGYVQGRRSAAAVNDPEAEERLKAQECMAIADSLPRLKRKIDAALSQEGLTREKLAAAVVLLINRQQFRVGSKVGDSSKKSKGEVGETFGITVVRPEHVKIEGDAAVFEFPGKSGKAWRRIDSDPRTLGILKDLLRKAAPGEPLWQYEGPDGQRRPLAAGDVRDYLREFGYTPHNFRHYYASLRYFQAAQDYAAGNGGAMPETAADMHRYAAQQAADVLNDEVATVEKNYVLGSLQRDVKAGKLPHDEYRLRRLELAEGKAQDGGDALGWFDVEHEDGFHNYLFDLWHEHEARVSLADAYGGAPPKALREGDRWVTIKPHGPDSPDYRHVIIRPSRDGSAMVVWSGHKGLTHLRLNKVGTKGQIEAEQRRKPKVLTPEQAQAEKEQRQKRTEALDKSRSTFGDRLTEKLGLGGKVDPAHVLAAFESGLMAPPKAEKEPKAPPTPEERALDDQKEKERLQDILGGEEPEGGAKPIDQPDELPEVVARRLVADLLGQDPGVLGEHADPELRAGWDAMREDPDKMREVNALVHGYRKEQAKIRREARGSGSIRVVGTLGHYAEDLPAYEKTMERDALEQAANEFQYKRRSEFHEAVDALDKAQKYHAQGMGDGLSHALASYGGTGATLNAASVDLFSPQVVAEAVAHHIRAQGDGARKAALDSLEKDFVAKEFDTVQEAMARSEELRAERRSIASDREAGNILKSAASRALAEATIAEKKHLARAAGSLESVALVLDSLRQDSPRPIHIQAGGHLDAMVRSFERVGMEEGKDFHLTDQGIQIPTESAPKFLKSLGKATKLDEKRALIKSHAANTADFHVPGMSQSFRGAGPLKLEPTQQSAIRFFESDDPTTDHRFLGNLGVGLGKTITFGAAHARLMERQKAAGKPHHGHYFVPAKLVAETVKGLREAFPDMDIQTTSGKDKKKRSEMYRKNHELLVCSSDSVREDAEDLAGIYGDESHKPGAIYGDEVHELFSPNASDKPEDQSRRSKALQKLHTDHMMVMTGTPFRQSLAEVWKVISWLHPGAERADGSRAPGPLGGISGFVRTYGALGQGTSAWAGTQEESLRRALDPFTITEKDPPKVEHTQVQERVRPSEEQFAAVRAADGRYQELRAAGRHKEKDAFGRDALGRRMASVSETMASGDPAKNPMIAAAKRHIDEAFDGKGERAIVHCVSRKAMDAVASAYPKGQVLRMWSGTSPIERERIKQAMNSGFPIEGGAASVGGKQGIVVKVERDLGGKPEGVYNVGVPKAATIRFEDGQERAFPMEDVRSEVRAMAGTSVTATGLNLQGTGLNVHLEAPDSAATKEQREARNFRRGRTKPVKSVYLVPDLPHGRRKARQLGEQARTMRGIDDPSEYAPGSTFMDPVVRREGERKAAERELAGAK